MEEKKKTAREIIEGYDGPPVRIMEVCGTHTHEIFRLGIRKLLPEPVSYTHLRPKLCTGVWHCAESQKRGK